MIASIFKETEGSVDSNVGNENKNESEGKLHRAQIGNDNSVSNNHSKSQHEQSSKSDVGIVVAKAKRAAASLWMVLHAQSCRYGLDNCPHKGCSDTKRLLLHVKTCSAGADFKCPEDFRGCQQAKKLLAHYRRCREIRARQINTGRSNSPKHHQRQEQQFCLVCALLARHARTMLDRFSSEETNPDFRSRLNTSQDLPTIRRTTSMQIMPPPPPRPPIKFGSKDKCETAVLQSPQEKSPPSTKDIVSAVSPQVTPQNVQPTSPSSLHSSELVFEDERVDIGQRFDSRQSSTLHNRPDSLKSGDFKQSQNLYRPRARSCDDQCKSPLVDKPKTAHTLSALHDVKGPIAERTINVNEDCSQPEQSCEEQKRVKTGRHRSASYDTLSSLFRGGGFETISEETAALGEQQIK